MAFTTALSGLNAAANNLAVTGNNIANANTTGFKGSRSEFGDVYASSVAGINKTAVGQGASVMDVAQQFKQGNTELTGNSLDMAIKGEGFFTLQDPATQSSLVYSRAGAFKLDKDGMVVNSSGQFLMAYKPNGKTVEEGFNDGTLAKISLNSEVGLPVSTTKANLSVNLDANSPLIVQATTAFDPKNPATYTKQTSMTVYDSLGVSHKLTSFFVARAVTAGPPATKDWDVYHYFDDPGTTPPTALAMKFDSNGKLTTPANGKFPIPAYTVPNSSASAINITMDYTGSTQLSSQFNVNALTQDGLAAGRLTSVDVNEQGVITASFSNGGSKPVGRVALTRFQNPQGLTKLGDATWATSPASGGPISGSVGEGSFGSIQSGALEQSNVDLSAQLVNLIIAQQTYQANSQTISTENNLLQNILQIR